MQWGVRNVCATSSLRGPPRVQDKALVSLGLSWPNPVSVLALAVKGSETLRPGAGPLSPFFGCVTLARHQPLWASVWDQIGKVLDLP